MGAVYIYIFTGSRSYTVKLTLQRSFAFDTDIIFFFLTTESNMAARQQEIPYQTIKLQVKACYYSLHVKLVSVNVGHHTALYNIEALPEYESQLDSILRSIHLS